MRHGTVDVADAFSTDLFSLLSTKPAESLWALSSQRRQDVFLHCFWVSSYHRRTLIQVTLTLSLVVSLLKSVCSDFSIFPREQCFIYYENRTQSTSTLFLGNFSQNGGGRNCGMGRHLFPSDYRSLGSVVSSYKLFQRFPEQSPPGWNRIWSILTRLLTSDYGINKRYYSHILYHYHPKQFYIKIIQIQAFRYIDGIQ